MTEASDVLGQIVGSRIPRVKSRPSPGIWASGGLAPRVGTRVWVRVWCLEWSGSVLKL